MKIRRCPICGADYNSFEPTILKVDECDSLGEFYGPVSFYQCDVCDARFGIFEDNRDKWNDDLELQDLEDEIIQVKLDRYEGLDNNESD